MSYTLIDSPIGELLATGEPAPDGASVLLTGLFPPGHRRAGERFGTRDDAAFADLRRQLGEYFAGTRREFDVATAPSGTAFQRSVWQALREIPYGRTASYGTVAVEIGAPTAARAVGGANARNPISIVVPCHRVIGGSGALTGYAGGFPAKQWLLEHERAHT